MFSSDIVKYCEKVFNTKFVSCCPFSFVTPNTQCPQTLDRTSADANPDVEGDAAGEGMVCAPNKPFPNQQNNRWKDLQSFTNWLRQAAKQGTKYGLSFSATIKLHYSSSIPQDRWRATPQSHPSRHRCTSKAIKVRFVLLYEAFFWYFSAIKYCTISDFHIKISI